MALPAFILHNRFLEICIGLGGVSTPGNLLLRRRRLLTVPEVLNLNEDYLGIVLKMNGLKCRVTRFARTNNLYRISCPFFSDHVAQLFKYAPRPVMKKKKKSDFENLYPTHARPENWNNAI